jgi:hypothetical protein
MMVASSSPTPFSLSADRLNITSLPVAVSVHGGVRRSAGEYRQNKRPFHLS